MNERCLCGDSECPTCGRLQGTYTERTPFDPDYETDKFLQGEIERVSEAASALQNPSTAFGEGTAAPAGEAPLSAPRAQQRKPL